ncbi:hypothetical protein SAMD00023353_5800440 [Rosellinia necatrix]|uniref:Uncharacterized protein n=1 Tax=Rosellinia necatrix TaxID=77044 RepID=A0A1S8AA47_ROSNE|nr:hypothetical protein SAMD00023353_5800440 [Rosellinia necatrix]
MCITAHDNLRGDMTSARGPVIGAPKPGPQPKSLNSVRAGALAVAIFGSLLHLVQTLDKKRSSQKGKTNPGLGVFG